MVVPSKISDNTLNYAAKYRSKARIPALSYMHWHNSVSWLCDMNVQETKKNVD